MLKKQLAWILATTQISLFATLPPHASELIKSRLSLGARDKSIPNFTTRGKTQATEEQTIHLLQKANEAHQKNDIEEEKRNLQNLEKIIDHGVQLDAVKAIIKYRLANIYSEQGDLANAQAIAEDGLAYLARKKVYKQELLQAVVILADIYRSRGYIDKAVKLLLKSTKISSENDYPKESSSIYNLLSLIYLDGGRVDRAYEMNLKALDIAFKSKEADQEYKLLLISNYLAIAHKSYEHTGIWKDDDEKMLFKGLELSRQIGFKSFASLQLLNIYGQTLLERGEYTDADNIFKEGLKAFRKITTPGDWSEIAIELGVNHAIASRYIGNPEEAKKTYITTLDFIEKHGSKNRLDLLARKNLSFLYWLEKDWPKTIEQLEKALLEENKLIYKFIQGSPAELKASSIHSGGDEWMWPFSLTPLTPEAIELALYSAWNRGPILFESLKFSSYQSQKSKSFTWNKEKRKGEQITQRDSEISSSHGSQVQKNSISISRSTKDNYKSLDVNLAQIKNILDEDSILIQYQRYTRFDPLSNRNDRWKENRYVAIIVFKKKAPVAIDIGRADLLDVKIKKSLNGLSEGLLDSEVYSSDLLDTLIKPLMPSFGGINKVYIAANGNIQRVPFAALAEVQSPTGLDLRKKRVIIIRNGRELIELSEKPQLPAKSVVISNPEYEPTGQGSKKWNKHIGERKNGGEGMKYWKNLDGTKEEGNNISRLLKAIVITGKSANETRISKITSPLILHIAAHGIFEKMSKADWNSYFNKGYMPGGIVVSKSTSKNEEAVHVMKSEVISKMNLHGTELAVVAACDSAEGEYSAGDGLLGLDRALKIAGARSTLLSLWKVDDSATAEFMTRFYTRLKAGEGRADALAATQKEFRDGQVRDPQTKLVWNRPYYWAAWQLVGDWRPIKGL